MSADTEILASVGSLADPPDGGGVAWWRPSRSWLPSVTIGLVALVIYWFARQTLIDDAYITLAYARNVAFHLHWGLIPGETANTATSVLNVLVLALFTAITRHPIVALGIVYLLSTLATEYGVRRAARAAGLPEWAGLLAAVVIAADPLLMSSIGLETALGAGITALLLAAAVERRPVLFGLFAGLLVLTRPDLAVLVIVLFLVRRGWWRDWWRSVLTALAVTVPWYAWSWLRLDSIVPDTLLIKTNQGSWPGFGREYSFGSGPLLYLRDYPTATVLSFLPAVLGLLAVLIWLVARLARPTDRVRALSRFVPIAVAGLVHYAAYTLLGVPPYHWYYGPAIICLSIFLAASVASVSGPLRVAPLALVVLLILATAGEYGRHGLPPRFAPIQTNWASPAEYQTLAIQTAAIADGRPVLSSGEVGTEAFFCDCQVIDEFGDRAQVIPLLNDALAKASPLKRKILDLNFHFLDRGQQPMTAKLALEFIKPGTPIPANAIKVWPVDSPWLPGPGPGPNHIVLVPTP